MIRRSVLAVALSFALATPVAAPSVAEAASLRSTVASCVDGFVALRNRRLADLSGRRLSWQADGRRVELELGDALGAGYFGRVYRLAAEPDPALLNVTPGYRGPVVAKMSHYKGGAEPGQKPLYTSASALRNELKNYREVEAHRAEFPKQPGYPRDPAWGDGLPVAPVVGALDTDRGLLLLKAFVKGRSAESFSSLDELTPEMRAGLEDMLAYGKAVNRAVPGGFVTDLRPTNLSWVDDPETLARLGYRRPGWVLYEQTRLPFGIQYYAKLDLPHYLEEFAGYLRPAAGTQAVPRVSAARVASGLAKSRGNLQRFVDDAHREAGPIFSVRHPFVPGGRLYMIADREAAREVLRDTDRNADSAFMKSRAQLHSLNKLSGDNNLFTAPLETWRAQRKQLAPAFTAKEVRRPDYEGRIGAIVDERLRAIAAPLARTDPGASARVDFKTLFHELTLDVIMRLLFGRELPPAELSRVAHVMQLAYEAVMMEGFNPLQTPLHKLPAVMPYQRKMRAAEAAWDKVIDEIITAFERDPDSSRGFMALVTKMSDPARGPITRKEIHDQILAFLFAGHETTAHTLTWALHEITENPAVAEKLTRLVRSGDEAAAYAYIDQVWSESLRLHMPIPLIPRETTRDVRVPTESGSVSIPKGTTLVLDTGTLHRREDVWGVANTGYPAAEFHPERFSAENSKARQMECEDLKSYAFGAGPRFCIGASMAGVEARRILFQMFRDFDVAPATGAAGRKISALNDALLAPSEVELKLAPGAAAPKDPAEVSR